MARFDRYMLSQLLLFFGFFALVLVAIFWINRGVSLFDELIGDGQSALVFLEFTILGLPRLVLLVLPLAAFAAAVYLTNRMSHESEFTVMFAAGSSPWRLARSVLVFGLSVGLMMGVLTHFLVPAAMERLMRREAEVSQDLVARLLTEGVFLHPSDNVTFFTRQIGQDGVLRDVFLSDWRNPASRVIYTANEAYLVREGEQTTLIMVDGLAQRLLQPEMTLATATFRDLSYDISSLLDVEDRAQRKIRAMQTSEFLRGYDAIAAETGQSTGFIAEEFHSRTSLPLFAIVSAMIGYSVLISARFSRFGAWREILMAFTALLMLDGLRAAVSDPVRADAALWPMIYIPFAAGSLLVCLLLMRASSRFRRVRAAPA